MNRCEPRIAAIGHGNGRSLSVIHWAQPRRETVSPNRPFLTTAQYRRETVSPNRPFLTTAQYDRSERGRSV